MKIIIIMILSANENKITIQHFEKGLPFWKNGLSLFSEFKAQRKCLSDFNNILFPSFLPFVRPFVVEEKLLIKLHNKKILKENRSSGWCVCVCV